MERLTKRIADGTAYTGAVIDASIKGVTYPTYIGMAVDKLAAYENAEEQELLLRLPCGIGTTVYEVENNTDACSECNDFERGYCCDDYCGNKNVHDEDGDVYVSNPQYADKPLCQKHFYEISEYTMNNVDRIFNRRKAFGKTVFLTYEEAEAKLKEMEEKHGE